MDTPDAVWSRCLEWTAQSDVGLRRVNNQDALAVSLADNQDDFQRRGHFFMVADGMGAHAAGELASKMATDAVPLIYRKRQDQSPSEALLSAVLDANGQIHNRGQASPDFHGMGTTATALALLPAGALVAHVGDSRAYRVRGARIEQLTFDHSLVWELRAAGQGSDVEVPSYITKNIITRSLGPNPTVQVDLEGPYAVQPGDVFLLCSDGLSGQVGDEEIGLILGCLAPAEAAQTLIDLANLRGGPDNITVGIARVLGPQIAQSVGAIEEPPQARLRPIHPLTWLVMAAAGLATAGFLVLGNLIGALAGALALTAALGAAMMQRHAGDRLHEDENRRFGRGPYVACECAPNAERLQRLAAAAEQLRDAAVRQNLSIDWTDFDRLMAEADSAGDPAVAARQRLKAIGTLMAQVRRLRDAPAPGDDGEIVPL